MTPRGIECSCALLCDAMRLGQFSFFPLCDGQYGTLVVRTEVRFRVVKNWDRVGSRRPREWKDRVVNDGTIGAQPNIKLMVDRMAVWVA